MKRTATVIGQLLIGWFFTTVILTTGIFVFLFLGVSGASLLVWNWLITIKVLVMLAKSAFVVAGILAVAMLIYDTKGYLEIWNDYE